MKLNDTQLKNLLLGSNLILYEKMEMASKEAEEKKVPLIDYLTATGLVSPEQLGRIIADSLKIKYARLKEEKLDTAVLSIVPEYMARSKGVIVFHESEDYIKIGMTDPDDLETRHMVEKKTGKRSTVYYITHQDLEYALTKYKGSIQKKVKKTIEALKNKNLPAYERDKITVEIVDTIIQFGYQSKASDIHIEPYTKELSVRFRIDGIMHDVLSLPKSVQEPIFSRIKILAKMRTDEHKAAQDGKIRTKTSIEDLDIRVSVVPVSEGEKAVLRLLASKDKAYGLEDLGLSNDNLDLINKVINNPHGMILVTGPTGSGKTTTIYGVLKILNRREVNIASIEDPVEYNIEGVNQIQVNNKTNLTFAKGLRAILRQDPDIIMVGEIRDEETANIAINSALTGHLVLSTLHTNDAATTLPRFLEMGIEPFLVASTVNVAIAQRLVRKICPKCKVSYMITDEEKMIISRDAHLRELIAIEGYSDYENLRLYKGQGCQVCNNTGFTGRIGVFEILEMSDEVKDLVLARASSDRILAAAKNNGMTTMLHDGVRKIFRGMTTMMEVVRVTAE